MDRRRDEFVMDRRREHGEFINIQMEDGTTRRCLVFDDDDHLVDLEERSTALERNIDGSEWPTGKRKAINQEIQSNDVLERSYGKGKLPIQRSKSVDLLEGSHRKENPSIQGNQSLNIREGTCGTEKPTIQGSHSLDIMGGKNGKGKMVTQRREREAIQVMQLNQVVITTALLILLRYYRVRSSHIPRAPYRVRHDWFLNDVIHGSNKMCYKITRMGKETFFKFCMMLRERNLLKDTINISVEEQVAMGLYILGHHTRIVSLVAAFERSSESISRHFNNFLKAICSLSNVYIRLPSKRTPHQILNNTKYYPWFKDCIGSIDETHVMVTADQKIVEKFRGRYKIPTQNILAAVDFDLRFVYVCSGWEGSSNDMAILKDSLTNEDGFRVPKGKYYLADAGYTTMPGFISPYRGVRYHLKDFCHTNGPRNEKELFNLRHAQLRNRVERAFGILKMRWRMLTTRSSYPTQTQAAAVMACCVLHNIIMDFNPVGDVFYHPSGFDEVGCNGPIVEDDIVYEEYVPDASARQRKHRNAPWVAKRDEMAALMWVEYQNKMSKN